ncbi:MAG: hypothetical protein M1827_007522 [Pycnora praestabilis]|nr:MAG: hypothetical protein M1827_007522 [Pycnora praestabilis]
MASGGVSVQSASATNYQLTSSVKPDRTRLHISPFNPSLVSSLIPPSILPYAQDISYHTLETFPEQNYGFVDLPTMEAEKIKKKLNGSILKGNKVRVEQARPERKRSRAEQVQEEEEPADVERRSKKRKREEGVLPGFELPGDRRVQRGWTEPTSHTTSTKDKKNRKDRRHGREKSKYAAGSECLFRTELPPNVASSASKTLLEKTKAKGKDEERSGKRKKGKEAVVHEFAHTTKHASFLRENQGSSAKPMVSEYVDGKGWVDAAGEVIEAQKPRSENKGPHGYVKSIPKTMTWDQVPEEERSIYGSPSQEEVVESTRNASIDEDEKSSSGISSDEEVSSDLQVSATSSEEDEAVDTEDTSPLKGKREKDSKLSSAKTKSRKSAPPINSISLLNTNDSKTINRTLSSTETLDTLSEKVEGDDSESSSSSAEEPANNHQPDLNKAKSKNTKKPSPMSGAAPRNTNDHETVRGALSSTEASPSQPIHPLEALFKRPSTSASATASKPSLEISTSFSFFDPDADAAADADITMSEVAPHTPCTQRDFHERGQRSAAPTPDTAAPGKLFPRSWDKDDGGDDENVGGDDTADKEMGITTLDATSPPEKTESIVVGVSEQATTGAESAFSNWFWEHRGETNRAWKRRRREALKEKRQRENRRGYRKVV